MDLAHDLPLCPNSGICSEENHIISLNLSVLMKFSFTLSKPLSKNLNIKLQFSSVQFSCVNSLRCMDCSTPGFPAHHQLPELGSDSCSLSQWCHLTISSFVVPFSSCLQSFPASGYFPMSQLFASGGQSIGASASVLPMNIQG